MKTLILSVLFISFNAFASIPNEQSQIEPKAYEQSTFSLIFDNDSNLICKSGGIISKTDLRNCTEQELYTSDSITKDGLRTAYLSHLAALGAGCVGGTVGSFFFNSPRVYRNLGLTGGLYEKDVDFDAIAPIFTGGVAIMATKAGVVQLTAVDPTGHILATSTGVIACGFVTHKVIKFFIEE